MPPKLKKKKPTVKKTTSAARSAAVVRKSKAKSWKSILKRRLLPKFHVILVYVSIMATVLTNKWLRAAFFTAWSKACPTEACVETLGRVQLLLEYYIGHINPSRLPKTASALWTEILQSASASTLGQKLGNPRDLLVYKKADQVASVIVRPFGPLIDAAAFVWRAVETSRTSKTIQESIGFLRDTAVSLVLKDPELVYVMKLDIYNRAFLDKVLKSRVWSPRTDDDIAILTDQEKTRLVQFWTLKLAEASQLMKTASHANNKDLLGKIMRVGKLVIKRVSV